MKQIRKRLTYANVMSSVAVFLVLGGATALAAGLGKNTVGTKQLKKNAVTTAKIKNEAVTGIKIKKGTITGNNLNLAALGTVPSATNANHASTADNATNVTNLPGVLASGQTLRGDVSDATDGSSAGTISSQNVSFPIPLASPPKVHIIKGTETPPAGCSGTPENPDASSGNLCIFIGTSEGPVGTFFTIDPENVIAAQPASGKFGFFIYNNSTASGRDQWWGSWAVTG